MNKKNLVLLKTMLLSSSSMNNMKYAQDKKTRSKAIGNMVGKSILFVLLLGYSFAVCVGYAQLGLINIIPAICPLMVAALAFVFTFIKTNGYLFNFKEYDMLMSLPYKPRTIAACKFLYMYVQSMPWYISISAAMMIGYGIYHKTSIVAYLMWIVLTFVLPILPMLMAAFIGFLIAKISSHFKKTNIVQTILTFALVIIVLGLQFIIGGAQEDLAEVEVVLGNIADLLLDTIKFLPPVNWFYHSIVYLDVLCFGLLIVSTFGLFWLVFLLVGKSYRQLNSAFQNHGQTRHFDMKLVRKHHVLNSIAFKEFRRFLGSTNYMVNCGMGEILALILGLVALFVGVDKVIAAMAQGVTVTTQMLVPAFPSIVYLLVGMVPTTACSPSLEGKNYWIIQSLPISKKTLYFGKMLFNMYLMVPTTVFSTLCLCISAGVNVSTVLLYVIEVVVLCAFSTTWGLVCGLMFMKLQWENELEVIKQSAAVGVYVLSHMLVAAGMVAFAVVMGGKIGPNLINIVITAVGGILTVICYLYSSTLMRLK